MQRRFRPHVIVMDDKIGSPEAGCDGHLVKPVNLLDLEKLLTELEPGGGAGEPNRGN